MLHKQKGPRHIMAGPKLASPSYFTLYFTLARVILLGQEIDFKSPFLRLTAPRHPPFPGPLPSLPRCKALLPLTPSSTSSGPTHTHSSPPHWGSYCPQFHVWMHFYDWLHLWHWNRSEGVGPWEGKPAAGNVTPNSWHLPGGSELAPNKKG